MKFCLKYSVVAVLASFALPAQAVVFPSPAPFVPGAKVYTPMTLDLTNVQSTLAGNSLTVGAIGINAANAVVVDRTYGGVTQSIHFVLQGGAVNFIGKPSLLTQSGLPMTNWLASTGLNLGCISLNCGTPSSQTFEASLMNPLLAFSSNGIASSTTSTGWIFSSTTNRNSFLSIGNLTPVASIPLAGSATYTGLLEGRVLGSDKDIAATLLLTTNFAARSVAFKSTNTFIYAPNAPVGTNKLTLNPNMDVTGTLTYLAGSGTFSGAVATSVAGGFVGTAQGRFYGLVGTTPAEMGGLVTLKNTATGSKVAGLFGAKANVPAQSVPAGVATYTPIVANFNVTNDPMTGALSLNTAAGLSATTANKISLFRLPNNLGTVGMNYSFTTQAAVGVTPATVVAGQVSTSGLTSSTIEASASGMMGSFFDGANKWLPTTGSYIGIGANIAMQSAAPANTYNYSDFGMWTVPPAGTFGNPGLLAAGAGQFLSVGSPTLATTIPVTGSATYAGTAVGYYQGAPIAAVAPSVGTTPAALQLLTANINATANFATRTLALSSTATQLMTPAGWDPMTGQALPNVTVAAPTLNMQGNLTWAAGTNAFSGAITAQGAGTVLAPALSGTAQGKFYGPVAGAVGATKPLEIGGAFKLSSTAGARVVGAFGAK